MNNQAGKFNANVRQEICPETHPLMQIAWRDCLMWACTFEPIVKQFREDTGCKFEVGKTSLDRMIDEAGGAETAYCKQFVEWFNLNVWGDSDELPRL